MHAEQQTKVGRNDGLERPCGPHCNTDVVVPLLNSFAPGARAPSAWQFFDSIASDELHNWLHAVELVSTLTSSPYIFRSGCSQPAGVVREEFCV
jgi:hypothetical protein